MCLIFAASATLLYQNNHPDLGVISCFICQKEQLHTEKKLETSKIIRTNTKGISKTLLCE